MILAEWLLHLVASSVRVCVCNVNINNYYHCLHAALEDSISQEDIQTLLYGLASKNYGITLPHPFQLEAAENAIRSCNTLVIQTTGKGKSLCYQLVALQSKKQVCFYPYYCLDA